MPTHKTHNQLIKVLCAIILGMLIGYCTQQDKLWGGINLYDYTYPIYVLGGTLFINALMLLVVPLVSSSIISGVARIGHEGGFGRLGMKTFSAFLGTNFLAILVGLLFANILTPGEAISLDHISAIAATTDISAPLASEEGFKFSDILLQLIPSNIVYAFSQGEMLGLIFFSIIFGFCISKIEAQPAATLSNFALGVFQAMIVFTHLIMKFLPIGVFFLVAKIFAETGLQSLQSLGLFTLAVLLGLATFVLVVLPALLILIARVQPLRHFKAMGPALITAFSTSSSSVTLPITIECVEKRVGVSNKICSLVIPLGTSLNMAGSALYVCLASLFVAQAYQIDLTLHTQSIIVLLAFITAIGVAGVPSSSLVAIIAILHAINVPAEGIGLFIAVDRILDMCRTTVNVFSDSCCAVLVARSEGEKNILT